MPRSPILSVTLSNPTLSYTPGGIVSGNVTFDCARDETIKKIQINFVGKVEDSLLYCFENTDHKCFDRLITLSESHKEYEDVFTLHKGRHKFPFDFKLPSWVTSNFSYGFANTVYYTRAILTRDSGSNTKSRKIFFKIKAVFDLNNVISSTNSKSVSDTEKIFRSFRNIGKIRSSLHLPKTGYVPGEYLRYDFEISNETEEKILSSITVRIFQKYTFTPNGIRIIPYARMTNKQLRNLPRSDSELCYYTKLSSVSKEFWLSAGEKKSGMGEILKIPLNYISTAVRTDDGCIKVEYKLAMKIKVGGMKTSRIYLPIIIGTIPPRSDTEPRGDFIQEDVGSNFPSLEASTILPEININNNYSFDNETNEITEISQELIRLAMEPPPPSYDEVVDDGALGAQCTLLRSAT